MFKTRMKEIIARVYVERRGTVSIEIPEDTSDDDIISALEEEAEAGNINWDDDYIGTIDVDDYEFAL